MALTKIIFGLHLTAKRTLTLDGQRPTNQSTEMTVVMSGVSTPAYIGYDSTNGWWQIELDPGDYVVRIDVADEDDWFDGNLTATLSSSASTAFVYHGPETASPNQHDTVAWTDSQTEAGSDPKDPWPPPGTAVTLPQGSKSWFDSVLHTAATGLDLSKGL